MRFAGVLALLLLTACAARPPARPFTYVALGASDAVGVGARNPETEGWVARFGARLGTQTRIVNLGVSGSTLAQALDEQLGAALDAQPDIVTIWLAVNDFNARVPLQSYARDLDRLLGAIEGTRARVLVGNIPNLALLAAASGVNAPLLLEEVDRWNAVIADAAARHGATVVDLYARWQEVAEHPEYLSQDGFHPSSEGYARLAEVFAEALDGAH
ncbi:MAG: SGNH/GDSL hydrolase family protein [Chloroflexota bacterium]|nr:SGNH/GDSL hydrolase family protein [Chloroflexota bacterium]